MLRIKKKKESQDPISRCLMEDTHTKIELWTQILYTFCLKVIVPIGAVPLYAASYILYYTTDMGADSFIIPTDLKWVFTTFTNRFYIEISFICIWDCHGTIAHRSDIFSAVACKSRHFCWFCRRWCWHLVWSLASLDLVYHFRVTFDDVSISYAKIIKLKKVPRNSPRILVIYFNWQWKSKSWVQLYNKMFRLISSFRFDIVVFICSMVEEYTELNKNVVTLFYGWSLIAICDSLLMCKVT